MAYYNTMVYSGMLCMVAVVVVVVAAAQEIYGGEAALSRHLQTISSCLEAGRVGV